MFTPNARISTFVNTGNVNVVNRRDVTSEYILYWHHVLLCSRLVPEFIEMFEETFAVSIV